MPVGEAKAFGYTQYDNLTSFFGSGAPLPQGAGYGVVVGFGLAFGILTTAVVRSALSAVRNVLRRQWHRHVQGFLVSLPFQDRLTDTAPCRSRQAYAPKAGRSSPHRGPCQ